VATVEVHLGLLVVLQKLDWYFFTLHSVWLGGQLVRMLDL